MLRLPIDLTSLRLRETALALALAAGLAARASALPAPPIGNGHPDVPGLNADALLDLADAQAVAQVHGTWRAQDAQIVEIDHHAAGADNKPSGAPNRTHDLLPRAGAADFDDSAWPVVDPASLETRRGTGRLCYEWYRFQFTVPETLGAAGAPGALSLRGTTAVLELTVDDYAEITVDGRLPTVLGQKGGALVAGWNAPNRVIVGQNLQPGQVIRVAVLASNGPLSDLPGNYIWIRSATLEFWKPERFAQLAGRTAVPLDIVRLDPALDAIVAPGTPLEKVADGFQFTEGPVWVKDGGYLLFSDPNANVIYRYEPKSGEVSVYRTKSGYKGLDIGQYHQPGSNGLALDGQGRLTIDEHGNRRVTRLEPNGVLTVLADRFEGKRLNSPNDLVYRSDGALYFTDPPFGLPEVFDDPRKELPFSGVFCLIGGELKCVSKELAGPNGLAFSPDEKFLYVDNWDPAKKVVMRYAVQPDGTLSDGKVFFDMQDAPEEEALDGLKVDARGNVFVSGPGGLWILSPEGKHLGTLKTPQLAANFAFGDDGGISLYMCARSAIYRLRLAPLDTHLRPASQP